jgi:hypothetical protein
MVTKFVQFSIAKGAPFKAFAMVLEEVRWSYEQAAGPDSGTLRLDEIRETTGPDGERAWAITFISDGVDRHEQ